MSEHSESNLMHEQDAVETNAADASPRAEAAGNGEQAAKPKLAATQAFAPDLQSEQDAARLVEILDNYLAELKAGKAPDREALIAAHPELAEPLQACLAGLEFIHAASDAEAVGAPQTLGDFRILREIGRGGMGAVFEAEQTSLGRRVALKILRFGGVSDPEAIQRFQREAETVARLHHTNIVPIFAVGSEQGVNYYAMQFIDGKSLDQVLRERTEQGEAIAPDTVAQWGLEAAEALAHAHARGVIHRDVKPSNLLIDNEEGRIWLTDFGLAKRLDDVTLSMTGALLGTPRYMSPEQAAATHHQLDHRTDIYSLGASLYELATGQPVFRGDSPHNVISQILSIDPDPPRKHRPSMPRDLETILMKCLSKDAAHRYDSARQLVDDLRAFLDGRPIAARRANVVERTTRWVKRQRRSVALAAGAAAATLLLVTLAVAGSYAWKRSRLAMLMLKTDNPPLVAELLRDGGHVVPPLTVPTQRRIEVPAGEYQLRLSSENRLSQNYDVTLEPGRLFDHKLDLEDQLLWKNVKLDRSYRLARIDQDPNTTSAEPSGLDDGRANAVRRSQAVVIELTSDGVRCLQGENGKSRWEVNLADPTHEIFKEVGIAWPWDRYGNGFDRGLSRFDERPWIVSGEMRTSDREVHPSEKETPTAEPIVDFNGDGTSDLLLAARHQAWMVAISGRDGEPLWMTARGDAAEGKNNRWIGSLNSATVYPPLPVHDQDGDGIADVLTVFVHAAGRSSDVQRWIELVSGSSGESIWRYDVPAELFTLAAGEEVPYELQWFHGLSGGYSSSGGSISSVRQHYKVRTPSRLGRHGTHAYLPTTPRIYARQTEPSYGALDRQVSDIEGLPKTAEPFGSKVLFVAGQHLVQLSLRNGQPVEDSPSNTGVRTTVQPQYGDMDGDGELDLLMVESLPDQGKFPMRRLIAWSNAKRSTLWQRDIQASEPRQEDLVTPIPTWPQLVDLDGDGVSEIIAPDGSTHSDWYSPPWGRIAVFDGRTGEPRWHRQLFNIDQQIEWFTVAPDIDEDGVREIIVASQWGEDFRLFVDCLSGRDGKNLWRLEQPLLNRENESGELRLANLSWYEASGDGWPQLVVRTRRTSGDVADRIVFISAGTGEMTHIAVGVTDVHPADIDADGVDDLVLFERANVHHLHNGGQLQVFRGVGRQAWRKIISPQRAIGDLDGDGVQDVVSSRTRGDLEARSGATGQRIWRMDFDAVYREFFVYPTHGRDVRHDLLLPSHDLNGDDTPDLFLTPTGTSHRGKQPLLVAISGRDGRVLWETDFTVQVTSGPFLLECRDLDGDDEAEVVLAAATDYGLADRGYYNGDHDPRLWLTVLSGRDGKIRWSQPLTETQSSSGGRQYELDRIWLEAAYADLDDDGTLDLLLPAQRSAGSTPLDMRAMSGLDGRTLWQSPLPDFHSPREAFSNAMPAATGDLDHDGQTEVAVLAMDRSTDNQGAARYVVQLTVLRGKTGEQLWQWETKADNWGNEVDQNADRVKHRLRPLLVNRADGKQWIALSIWNNIRELHVLDETGRPVSQLQAEQVFDAFGRRLWTIDADDDGNDELVFLTDTQISLLPAERLDQPIWTRDERVSDLNRVVGLLPDETAAGQIVVLGGAGDHSLRGLDPLTGRTAWTCVGPTAEDVQITDEMSVLLNPPSTELPPHTLYQLDDQAFVRRGVLSEMNRDSWQRYARPDPTVVPATFDSRLLRPLPWKPADHQLEAMPATVGRYALYGVTLAGVPLLMAAWMIRRRRWGMKTLLMLPMVAIIVIMALLIRSRDPEFYSPWNKLVVAYAVAGPVMFALAVFGRWLHAGYWRRVVIWLSIAVLIGLGINAGSLLIAAFSQSGALQPGERYSWKGWYFAFVPVLYLMSWMLMIVVIVKWAVLAIWRWRANRPRPDMALGGK